MFTIFIAAILTVAAIFMFGKQLQGLIVSISVMLVLVLIIQTIGCESVFDRMKRRKEQRRERFQEWRQVEPIDDDSDGRRFRRFRNR